MSNASTGVDRAVVILMELNPLIVYTKALRLICRHPEAGPVAAEMITNYAQAFDSLEDDFAILDRARS